MSRFLCLAGMIVVFSTVAAGDASADKPPATSAPASQPADQAILKTLRPGHPRLVALAADIDRVRRMVKDHEQPRIWHEAMTKKAEKLLTEPTLEYKLIGPRLLDVSRSACDRIYTLGLLYRLDGDKRYADRGIRELLAICAFQDWHPDHFLDTAEMTHAAGIGYDWFYDRMTADQRKIVRQAIIAKGLNPAVEAYNGANYGWWVKCHHNWNQVCNGGISIGALAIADEDPQLAAFILNSALHSLPLVMKEYAPDGGWAEGPGYWSYATRYTAYFLAAMDSALGNDHGISKTAGFDKAGDFRLYSVGPTNRTFNYADADDAAESTAEMFWLARRFDKPVYAWHERQRKYDGDSLDLLWFDPRGGSPDKAGLPLDRVFRGVDVAFLRSSWEDPDAIFMGFKGGDNKANHSHLDLGTFVLDALGQRWALDLGADEYNLPGYFGKQRFSYYRLRTEGHNTLLIDNHNQAEDGRANIIAFESTPTRALAVADLSAGYKGSAERVLRGVALLDRRSVLVQDEITMKDPAPLAWSMHTQAKIDAKGDIATLTLGGAHLQARILEPAGARFEAASAEMAPPQDQNKDVRKLLIHIPAKAGSTRIAVLLTPYRETLTESAPSLKPLEQWAGTAKID
jgi:hypothetical protein